MSTIGNCERKNNTCNLIALKNSLRYKVYSTYSTKAIYGVP